MRRVLLAMSVFVLCIPVTVDASISIGVSGPGVLTNTYEGLVTFPQASGFTGQGTVTDWSISGYDPVIKTVTYAQSDLDFVGAFGSGFRWAETITNTSTSPWTDFFIKLIDTSLTFSTNGNFLNTGIGTEQVPGFATITSPPIPVITVLSTLGTPLPVLGWVMNLSADQREISMSFPTPILPAQSFQVHIPIEQIGDGGGRFTLSQQAASTPEPCALVVWTLLAAIGLGIDRSRVRIA